KEQQGSQKGEILKLQHELDQMKIMLAKVMTKDAEKTEYTSLQEALVQQEVDTQVIQDIIRQTQPDIILSDKKSPAVKEALVSYLENAVDLSAGIKLEPDKTKIVALIGTTGVGKTTTLAKIAAKFVLEQGVSAALITADTYRISAVEQLKTYSDIIGLPIEIVYSPGELKQAIDKHRDKRLILIDTAGRSQHNDYQIQELKELLLVEPEVEKHLVMSATTKYRDAKDILRNFAVCEPNRILFTKIDETSSLGLIVNLLFGHSTVLSYLTDGQSVPDDIFPAETHKLADLLLR
ncbi:MAG: flagellar biosynthesis protein FlhF, partial [Selenomonadaceae bacterium]